MFNFLLSFTFLFVCSACWAATDPTKPFSGYSAENNGIEENKSLILKSIIHGNGVHTVIINQQLMKVGDKIGEFKLIAVNDNSVILRSDDESKKLFIFSEKIAK